MRTLDDYADELPDTLPLDDLADGVPDSASEDSDIDEPMPLDAPPAHESAAIAGPSRLAHGLPTHGGATTPAARGQQVRPNSIINRAQAAGPPAARVEAMAMPGSSGTDVSSSPDDLYYAVQWRKPQTKKTWDGDAFIRITGGRCYLLKDEDGEQMGQCAIGGGPPGEGTPLRIGNYDVEVERSVTFDEFAQTTSILNKPSARALPKAYAPKAFAKPFKPPTAQRAPREMPAYLPARGHNNGEDNDENGPIPVAGPSRIPSGAPNAPYRTPIPKLKTIAASTFYAQPQAKKVAGDKIVIGEKSAKQRKEWGGAMFDPNAEGAVVMAQPQEKEAKDRNTEINDVVLDPDLAKKMRVHQREGLKFMYSCVMGLTEAEANGCILADEMGLGKTLQTIALIYTLLKQSPFKNEKAVIGKALIVCPVSLCDNWKREFRKWLRPDQVFAVVADGTDSQISSFVNYPGQHVLIIGYEKLRKHIKRLASCVPPIGLIICDEGHRLKAKDNKTTKAFDILRTPRRISTPVQNDLGEYWAMVDFCCPGLLGTYKQFNKHYEKPILRSREVGASETVIENGKMKAEELGKLSKEFVLRRTADVLDNYLPAKFEYVIFVAPSKLQLEVYASILAPGLAQRLMGGGGGGVGVQGLALIDLLRKVSNTPMLLKKDDEASRSAEVGSATEAGLSVIPRGIKKTDTSISGKMAFLADMLAEINMTTEKVVVVSNWTATLDIIQELCKIKRYNYLRLDGSTNAKERQGLVDAFNRESKYDSFVFLLSAKAGGVGLNLIGASRLILFDSDWNPSTDLQAMARIHRDGQKNKVYIYRLLTTNTIDEKIYQRQITKTGLSDQMLDQKQGKESKDSFSPAELKDIFTLKTTTDGCQTHDLLQCDCLEPKALRETDENIAKDGKSDEDDEEEQRGFVSATQYNPAPSAKMLKKQALEQQQKLAALKNWTHFAGLDINSFNGIEDPVLYNVMFAKHDEEDDVEAALPYSDGFEDADDSGIQLGQSAPKNKRPRPSDIDPLAHIPSPARSFGSDDSPAKAKDGEDDGVDIPGIEMLPDSADEGDSDADPDEPKSIGSKRKRPSEPATANAATANVKDKGKGKGKQAAKRSERGLFNVSAERKYSLDKVAEGKGGTGKVMFVFERQNKGKILGSRDTSREGSEVV